VTHYQLQSAKIQRREPLYSHFQLPIIGAMKIWFSIDGDRIRPQQAQTVRSAEPEDGLLRYSSTEPLAPMVSCHPRSRRSCRAISNLLPQSEVSEGSALQNGISVRFWAKSRKFRKQSIKPSSTRGHNLMHRPTPLDTFSGASPAFLRISGKFMAVLLFLSIAATTPLAAQELTIPELFGSGEAALHAGNLDQAESSFKQILAQDPDSAGAYANLGVIAMRRQNWPAALDLLRKAEHLAPNVAGIRLNIGLVYYRQNEFHSAIAPFESVVRDQPESLQARYLLGLCYFFTDRYADAVQALQDLWPQESNDLNYLYVLGNAADKAGNSELQDRALSRFVELGQNTAEYHMLMGKAFLNREENDKALAELEQAAKSDPHLPFVHFNLGLVYLARLDFDRAKDQFEKDIALEPDVAFNYDRLGLVYIYQQQDAKAEENFREALRRDSHLSSSYFGLARVYQHEKKFDRALSAIDAAVKIDPDNPNYHNLKGQILLREGHTQDGQTELAKATTLLNASRARRQSELSGEALPQPELIAEPKP
jgi:tetratricopeptide (TPR) repeat protein